MATADQLAGAYRSGQLGHRAASLRELARLWPMVEIGSLSATIGGFASAAARVVLGGWDLTAGDTALFLADYRTARGVAGDLLFPPAPAPQESEVAGLVLGAAVSGITNGRKAGMNATKAMNNGLTKMLGNAGKLVLAGGRSTIELGNRRDPKAAGWERDVSSGACDFCLMLASRGPAYTSERSSSFEAHDHCGCTGRLAYAPSDRSAQLAREWADVTKGLSGAAARIAWRRHVEDRG